MKKAFSLVEIGIILFIIAAVTFIVVPFSISNVKQAKFIAAWKDYMGQVTYSYEILSEYKKNNELTRDDAFEKLMGYLNAGEVSKNSQELVGYKYKMLNGKFYQNINLDKFDAVYVDIQNRIIGVEKGKTCSSFQPCRTVWIDINGKDKPNIVGEDIFVYEIYSDGVMPYGKGLGIDSLRRDCSRSGSGMTCSEYYLIGGDLK